MLDPALRASVQRLVQQGMGPAVQLTQIHPISGGCINEACIVETNIGRSLFLKWNRHAIEGLLASEIVGLEAIRETGAIRVPEIIGHDVTPDGLSFLVLEWIDSQSPSKHFEADLGCRLASLHRLGEAEQYGFAQQNFIGTTMQPNGWHADWLEFWKTSRMGVQLTLARENGYGDQAFSRLGDRLMVRMDSMLSDSLRPSLIHGDLWSGNFLADEKGFPVLLDPAAYYADREAEFGMLTLFGGLSDSFYDAYREAWPLAAGAEERIEIYRLYHLLNHLNLFGATYLSDCLKIMRKYS